MSYFLTHLTNGWQVDQAILAEEDRVVVLRFGHDWMYELYDPCTIMFFYRNRHIMIDLGTGNNNKINFVLDNKQEMIDIIETVYRGASKGKGLVVSPRDYSTKRKY